MTHQQTWDRVKAKSDALWEKSRSPLAYEVFHLIGGAHDNACDSLSEGVPEDRWHEMAVGSLTDLVSSRECSPRAAAWFRRVGFKF